MIRAIIFDFNGVIVDDEPEHFRLFQKVLAEEGMKLTKDNYYSRYLGMDDHDCFKAASRDLKKELDDKKIEELIERKAVYYEKEVLADPPFVPGALSLIRDLGKTHYLAIVSGALRSEIEGILQKGGVRDCISAIVAAGEVAAGKPDPEGFRKGMELLNRDYVASSERLLPEECLAIEDSHWGLEAATASGMPCVGVTTTYEEKVLKDAVICLKDFSGTSGEEFLKRVEAKL